MSRTRRKLTALSALLVLLAATSAGAREVCPESERLDALVNVSFVRLAETETDREEAVLRLSNGSGCGVVVRVQSAPVVVSPGGVRVVKEDEELPDGARVALDYKVHMPQLTGTVEPPSWGGDGGCVVELATIPAGRSVLFRVPASKFRQRYNIAVPFYFVGEGGPRHQSFFYWGALPES